MAENCYYLDLETREIFTSLAQAARANQMTCGELRRTIKTYGFIRKIEGKLPSDVYRDPYTRRIFTSEATAYAMLQASQQPIYQLVCRPTAGAKHNLARKPKAKKPDKVQTTSEMPTTPQPTKPRPKSPAKAQRHWKIKELKSRNILNLETGIVYKGIEDAADWLSLTQGQTRDCIINTRADYNEANLANLMLID